MLTYVRIAIFGQCTYNFNQAADFGRFILFNKLLLFLLCIGCLSGIAWLIWWKFLQPKPEAVVTIKPEQDSYTYGKTIAVSWAIKNFNNIEKTLIFDSKLGQDNFNTKCFYFDPNLSQPNCTLITPSQLPNNCQIQANTVDCNNLVFYHAKKPDSYIFKIQAIIKQEQTIEQETEPITITERPTLQVYEPLKTSDTTYQPNENITLEFEVSNISNLTSEDKVFLIVNNQRQAQPILTSDNINQNCIPSISDRYLCKVNVPRLPQGEYNLGVEVQYAPDGLVKSEPQRLISSQQIAVQTPIKLQYFRINNSYSGTLEIEPDKPISVSWWVTGDAKVNIDCIGVQPGLRGSERLNVPPGVIESCELDILDQKGKLIQTKTLRVKVKERPKPEPEKPKIEFDSLFNF